MTKLTEELAVYAAEWYHNSVKTNTTTLQL